jgi:hypothetical protein
MAVYLQAGRSPYAAAPSPADALGALRIGLLQHATLLGAALAAFLAGLSMGEDLTTGTVETWRFTDARWRRRWLRRVAALAGVLLVSAGSTGLVLRVAVPDGAGGLSSWRDLAVDGLPALLVIICFAATSLAASLLLKNPLLLVAATVALLAVPSFLAGPMADAMPSAWIGQALHLTENGTSVNYVAQQSGYLDRTPSQWVGLAVITSVTLVAMALGATGAERSRSSGG